MKQLQQMVGVKRKLVESLSSGDSNDETKEGILKFIDERRESVKENDIEGWISEACSLLEGLNLSFFEQQQF